MRLIDADKLKEYIDAQKGRPFIGCTIGEALKIMTDEQPTVDAVPVVHGRWKQSEEYGFEETYQCTACGESYVLIEGTPAENGYKYCPNCGAKMDKYEID